MGVGIRGDGRRRPRRLAARGIGGALAGIALVAAMMVPVAVHAAAASVETATLAVNYRLAQPDGNMIAESYVAEMPTGSDYSVESPDIEGFALQDQSQATVAGTLDADRTVEVLYDYAEKSVGYTVEYVGVDSNGKTTVLATDTTGTAEPGATATVPSRAFEGYAQRTTDLTLVVTPDGKAKKTVYYEKAEGTVYVLFDTNGSYVAPVGLLAGERLDESDELKTSLETEPTRAGYEFDGWMLDGEKVGSVADLPETMPAEDIVLTAAWAPGTSTYTVEFYFENVNDDNYTWDRTLNETRTATTGTTATVTQADKDLANEQLAIDAGTYDVYQQGKFYGFNYDHCEDATVNEDGSGVLRLYYSRETWTIYLMDNLVGTHAYDRDYLTKLTEFNSWEKVVWKEFSGKYGSSVPDGFPTNDELMAHVMGLKETADEKYQRSDLMYAGYTQVYTNANGHGGTFDDDDELRHASWYSFGSFGVEDKDKPGSRSVHVYPALSEGSYNYYITWKGEKLGVHGVEPDDFETVNQQIAGPTSSRIGPTFYASKIEGFTYVGGAMQSFCESDKCSISKTVYAVPTTGFLGDFHGVGCTHTGYMRVEDQSSWDPVLQACWLDTDVHLDSSTGGTKGLKIAQYTTYYLRREKYPVTFMDGEDVLRTVEDVYYEQPLNAVPTADGGTEDILAYVPETVPEGMRFDGWYISSDTSDSSNAASSDLTMPAGALTLYAKWAPLDLTVEFDSCGGSDVDDQSVPYNGKATEPEEPTRAGFEFMGWFTEDEGGERWSFDRPVEKDTTLYAHWRGINVGTLTVYHVMEGETEPFATEQIQSVKGATVVAEALVPQDSGYPDDAYLKPDYAQKSQEITGDPDKDVVTFTYVPASQRDYTVRYLESGTGAELAPAREVTTLNSYVTEVAKGVDGYSVDHEWIAQPVKDGDVITFWYTAGDPGVDPDPDQPEDSGDTPDPDQPEQPDPGETPDQPDPGETPDQPVRPAGDGGEKNDAALPATGDASLAIAPVLLAGCAAAAIGLRAARRR